LALKVRKRRKKVTGSSGAFEAGRRTWQGGTDESVENKNIGKAKRDWKREGVTRAEVFVGAERTGTETCCLREKII
jgi:hypothetical protein